MRLILLLLLALVLSHAISLAILDHERRLALQDAAQDAAIDRLIAVHTLLLETPKDLHTTILEATSTPRLQFRLKKRTRLRRGTPENRLTRQIRATLANETDLPLDHVRIAYRRHFEKNSADIFFGTHTPSFLTSDLFNEHFWDPSDELEEEDRGDNRFWWTRFLGQGRTLKPGMVAAIRLPGQTGWLEAATRLTLHERPWASPVFTSLATSGLAVILIVILVIQRTTRPLQHLTEQADAIGKGGNPAPLTPRGSIETQRLIVAFNTMQERQEKFLRDRMHMLAAMSHDLRTPITTLRLRAELLEDTQAKAQICATLDEFQAMAEEVLAFIKTEAHEEKPQKIDLISFLDSLCEDMRDQGENASLMPPPHQNRLIIQARPIALKRALRNLIENAIRYGEAATIRAENTKECITIAITDQGPGLPPEELERVFDPFIRTETSRNRTTGGMGLGLSIAQSIIRSHGGEIHLENNTTPPGLTAMITLPI